MAIHDYTDERGIPRKVLLPDGETNARRGIPISLNVDSLYEHMPVEFLQALYPALWARGIVTAQDALRPDAAGRIQAALLSVVKHDVFNIQSIARGE